MVALVVSGLILGASRDKGGKEADLRWGASKSGGEKEVNRDRSRQFSSLTPLKRTYSMVKALVVLPMIPVSQMCSELGGILCTSSIKLGAIHQDGRWQPYPSANMAYDKLTASVLTEKYYLEMGCVIINLVLACRMFALSGFADNGRKTGTNVQSDSPKQFDILYKIMWVYDGHLLILRKFAPPVCFVWYMLINGVCRA